LVVDADAVLSGSISAQRFKAVTGWNPEVVEPAGDLELAELAAGHPFDGLEARDRPTVGEGFEYPCIGTTGSCLDHSSATQNG